MFNGHLALAAPIYKPLPGSVPDSKASAMNFLRCVSAALTALASAIFVLNSRSSSRLRQSGHDGTASVSFSSFLASSDNHQVTTRALPRNI
jgi:hypothetical protein